jgi:hypothetical protein
MASLLLALLLDAVGGVVCGRGEKRGNLGLDLSLLGQETLQSFFIGQRVVEPWVGHVERLSLHALGRAKRWFGRGLERSKSLQPRLVSSGFVSRQKQLSTRRLK